MIKLISNHDSADILILDTDPADLAFLENLLKQQGYRVYTFSDREAAIASLGIILPDLILLDMRVQGANRAQVYEFLRIAPKNNDIPIIFIETNDGSIEEIINLQEGDFDYITQPLSSHDILARVQTRLTLRRLKKQLLSTNQQLEEHLAELQARNEELDAFAHTVAHDIKNPLGIILGYASFAEQSYNSLPAETCQQAFRNIARSAIKINSIIESLLQLAGVRHISVVSEPLEMSDIVSEALERISIMIEDSGAAIKQPPYWPAALGYAPWVEEVWANFLSNAIKYGGKPPQIELGAQLEGDLARFWVRDNGRGLSIEEQKRLFKPFTQLERSSPKGHGLGLSIVGRIIERLGGTVAVDSQPGHGSTFSFTLPKASKDSTSPDKNISSL